MESKKSSSVLWLVIVVLVAIIALGIGWYLGSKGRDKRVDNLEEKVQEQIKKDDKIFEEVEKKVEYLYQINNLGNRPLFEKNRTVDEFSETDLLYPVLFNTDWETLKEYSCYDPETKKILNSENCGNKMIGEVTGHIEVSKIEKFFEDLYGRKFSKKDRYDGCPMLLIDEERTGYYTASPCGGTGFDTEYHYIYNKEIKDGKVYVYVAYGVDDCCSDIPKVYTDYKKKNKYEGKVEQGFKITEENYKDFSKYKLTFEEKDENYHFAAIELVEKK